MADPPVQYVTELSASDVLFGRGSGPNDHPGNVKFREYVSVRKAAYMATSHRLTKTNLAKEILDLVSADGGRFLRKVENETTEQELYEIVDDHTIMEKAKQALRQNANKARETTAATSPPQQTTTSLPIDPFDLEPIPYTQSGYSGPLPTTSSRQPPQPILYEMTTTNNDNNDTTPNPIPLNVPSTYAQHHQQQQQQQQQRHPATMQQHASPSQLYGLGYSQGGSYGSQQQQQQQQQPYSTIPQRSVVSNHSDDSMAGLYSEYNNRGANKRASLTIEDLQGFNPKLFGKTHAGKSSDVEVDELSTSFSNMKTVQEEEQASVPNMMMLASTETMGTIDNLGSIADMSITSSTLSIFDRQGSSTTDRDGLASRHVTYTQQETTPSSIPPVDNNSGSTTISSRNNSRHGSSVKSRMSRQSGESTNSSISFDGLFDNSTSKKSIDGTFASVRKQVDQELYPRSVAILEESTDEDPFVPIMGQSSIDVMKQVLDDSETMMPPPAAHDQRQQYYQQDPK